MCELFGVNASEKIQLNTLLKSFFSHGEKHPHGWGMAFLGDNTVRIDKQPMAAHKSVRLRDYLGQGIAADKMIAHIRLATKGNIEYENCHPFVMEDDSGRVWVLAHNGTIFESEILNQYFYVQEGQTDSERILHLLIDRVNQGQREKSRPLTAVERFRLLDKIIWEIAEENKLNLLIYDGEYFYVHTNYRNSLYISEREGGFLFSTTPLDEEEWRPLQLNTLLVYQNGKLVYAGRRHGYEYEEDEEKMRMLFLDYSAL